ncbi:hypothetical protein D3C75_1149360 [compost metagenome]
MSTPARIPVLSRSALRLSLTSLVCRALFNPNEEISWSFVNLHILIIIYQLQKYIFQAILALYFFRLAMGYQLSPLDDRYLIAELLCHIQHMG